MGPFVLKQESHGEPGFDDRRPSLSGGRGSRELDGSALNIVPRHS